MIGWEPLRTVTEIVADVATWIRDNEEMLRPALA